MRPVFIYFLKDPTNPIKGYVGKTANPCARLASHFYESKHRKHYRANWIRSLRAKGLKPEFEVVAQVPEAGWQQWEIDYIAAFRSMGFELVNGTNGGDAGPDCTGRKHTPKELEKMSASQRGEKGNNFGKIASEETRAKMRAAREGYVPTPETIAKTVAKNTGKKRTPEQCKQNSISHLGKKSTPESRAKTSATLQGMKFAKSKSKFRGVNWDPVNKKWYGRIGVFGGYVFLGRFLIEEDAARACDVAAKQHYGITAKLNFPDSDFQKG